MDQQFLFLARIKEAEKTSIGVPTLTNFYEFQFEQARQSRGYVPALSAPLDPNDATSILVETEREDYPKTDPNNPVRDYKSISRYYRICTNRKRAKGTS